MKKVIIFLAFCIAFTACKQKQVECIRHITVLPCDVAFAGFSADELDTVVLTQYNAATGFAELLETDTMFIVTPEIKDGVTYSDTSTYRYKGFFTLNARNYKVYFPAIDRTYRITAVTSPPDTDTFISMGENCPAGTMGPFLETVSSKIDGNQVEVFTPNANNFFILIHR